MSRKQEEFEEYDDEEDEEDFNQEESGEDVEINDDDDNEYDDEEDEAENDFIVADNEVEDEYDADEGRKKKKKKKKAKAKTTTTGGIDELDDEDQEIINQVYEKRKKKLIKNIEVEDEDAEEIQLQGPPKRKNIREKMQRAKDGLSNWHQERQLMQTEDMDQDQDEKDQGGWDVEHGKEYAGDELFSSPQDEEIADKDIPERLQIKLAGRFNPEDDELEKEARWMFNNLEFESLPAQHILQFRDEIVQEIIQALRYFRCDHYDVPYVMHYFGHKLSHIGQSHIWQIFNFDIEYGKFLAQKKQVQDFLKNISDMQTDKQAETRKELEQHIEKVQFAKDKSELRDYEPLIDFYKAYFQKELEQVAANRSDMPEKKLPSQRRHFITEARAQRHDQFVKRGLLRPHEFVQNIQADSLINKPNPPEGVRIREILKEYVIQGAEEDEAAFVKRIKRFRRSSLSFAAFELCCEPGIRKYLKDKVRENGVLITEPTEKGKKELDTLHPSYRVKSQHLYVRELSIGDNQDLFLDIMQNEQLGLIRHRIEVLNEQELFLRMFELYDGGASDTQDVFKNPSGEVSELQKEWNFAYQQIKKIFLKGPSIMTSNSRQAQQDCSFLKVIIQEIEEELYEEAEAFVTRQCQKKYRDLVGTGYFKSLPEDKYRGEMRQQGSEEVLGNFGGRGKDKITQDSYQIEDDHMWQRERLCVMSAILNPIDDRNYKTTIAIVDKQGELKLTKDFYHMLQPRQFKRIEDPSNKHMVGVNNVQDEEHEKSCIQMREMLHHNDVDLIVVAADCLEARKLKKVFSEIHRVKTEAETDELAHQQQMPNKKDIQVIWGRPEVSKLFANSQFCKKMYKSVPFVAQKAICLARFEQDPMNEVLNLWSPIISENQALNLNLHPLQKHISKPRLMDVLDIVNIDVVNQVGVDINMLISQGHYSNQLQFVSGLGPRKAQNLLRRLKKRSSPIVSRMDLLTNNLLTPKCFMSASSFMKVSIPKTKRHEPFDGAPNLLDCTRIQSSDYTFMERIAAFIMYKDGKEDLDKMFSGHTSREAEEKKQMAIHGLFRDIAKLDEDLIFPDLKQYLLAGDPKRDDPIYVDQCWHRVNQIISIFKNQFKDPREAKARTVHNQGFPDIEILYCLIDETEQTFKEGNIVSATVIRVAGANGDRDRKVQCKLENGLDATVKDCDEEFIHSVSKGSIIQGRLAKIHIDNHTEQMFQLVIYCDKDRLERYDRYAGPIGLHKDDRLPPPPPLLQSSKDQNRQESKVRNFQKRQIQHVRFRNISSKEAIALLQNEDNGDFYFRPCSRGNNYVTLTWKFFETNIVHIDIEEHDKRPGAVIGSKLVISSDTFDNLQEIIERYITPCNHFLRSVISHPKYVRCNHIDEVMTALQEQKAQDSTMIPYRFTMLDDYPQYLILAYIPKKDVVQEFVKVKPRGFYFHGIYQYPFQNLINWFKKNYKSPKYQNELKCTPAPTKVSGGLPPIRQSMDMHPQGLQINEPHDQMATLGGGYNQEPWQGVRQPEMPNQPPRGYGRGGGATRGGMGHSRRDRSNSPRGADEEFKRSEGQQWGRDQYDRRMGRPTGSGYTCYTCGQEGHLARQCPQKSQHGRQDAKAICYKCRQTGHLAYQCPNNRDPEMRTPPPYKRQKRDEDQETFRRPNNESTWKTGGEPADMMHQDKSQQERGFADPEPGWN